MLSSRHRYKTCSFNGLVSSLRTSGTLPLETIDLRKGVSCSRIVSSMSSYQDSTQMPLSGVVWMKFSARLSMIMVLSKGRPRLRRSLLKIFRFKYNYNTLHSHHVELYAICKADV